MTLKTIITIHNTYTFNVTYFKCTFSYNILYDYYWHFILFACIHYIQATSCYMLKEYFQNFLKFDFQTIYFHNIQIYIVSYNL